MRDPSAPLEAPPPAQGAAADAARELAALHEQIKRARVQLGRLHSDLLEAQALLDSSPAAQLLEANEQLVLGMLRAQTAAQALNAASRSAELDALTELPNRVLLFDRFARAIAAAKRHGARLALLFVDLDGFKQINDSLGHAAGDEVLQLAAHCLASAVRDADTVSRYGGDEFAILLTEVSQASDAVLIADKVLASLALPRRIGGRELRLAASIGIGIYPDDGTDAETLIARADAAMYRAKRQGLGSVVVHGEPAGRERGAAAPVLVGLQRPLVGDVSASLEHERRHAQIREANEQLVLATLAAQHLRDGAVQAQRRQREFLAMLAHELRTPLTPIRTAAALLHRVRADDPLLARAQAVIERQVAHVSRLVEDLLDVSRIDTGKLRLERRRVEMGQIVNEAIEMCRSAMDTRMQQFSVRVPPTALYVDGDPVRLAQVLCNLLGNASKYTPEGGEIELVVAAHDAALVMTVSDNGIGITAAALPNVFEPFVQDTHAIGFNGAGLGIGLTVVRELVEAHGGHVVASSPGTGLGSRFVVTLPLAAAA